MSRRRPLLETTRTWTEDAVAALYRVASVDPDRFLVQMRSRGLHVTRIEDLAGLDDAIRDGVAEELIRRSRRISAITGVGMGFGGWAALPPDLAQQLVMILQLAQRLSLLYGLDYRSPAGELELWKAVAAGIGARIDVVGTPRDVGWRLPVAFGRRRLALGPIAGKIAAAVVRRLVTRLSAPLGRMVPVVGSGVGLVSNYLLMGRVGHRMMAYHRRRLGAAAGPAAAVAVADVVDPAVP